MGKKLQKLELCEEDESKCFSSRGLFNVFHLWQNSSNQKLIADGRHFNQLVSGSEHPKAKKNPRTDHDGKHGIIKDKTDDKLLRVDSGKITVKDLMNEESSTEYSKFRGMEFSEKKQESDEQRRNLPKEKKEAETFINEALRKYINEDRRKHHSQRFLQAITILKSNEELFLKLMQDPNSLLVKHIQNLQDLHAAKERSELASKSKCSVSTASTITKNTYDLVWDKNKSRYEYPSKLRKSPRVFRNVEISESVSCYCSSLNSHSSRNKNKIVDPPHISLNTKLESTKEDDRKDSKGCLETLIDDNVRKSISSFTIKGTDFDIVEEEAKRHLSERLMKVNLNKCFSEKESPRVLGNILHLPKSRIFDSELDKLKNQLLDTKEGEAISLTTSGIGSADPTENMEATILSQPRDFSMLEFSTSPDSTNGTITGQSIDADSSSEILEDSGCSGHDSLPDDPSSTSINIHDLEIMERARDKADLPSPVSVLKPFFCEDFDSPPSITQPDKPLIQPPHINFEEISPMGSSPNLAIDSENFINELDVISTYMDALLKSACSSWEELFLSWGCPYSTVQNFNPNLIDEFLLPYIDVYDQKLYFDSVNEAVSEVYQSYFCSSSLVSKPLLTKTSVVDEIKRRVDQYFHPSALPNTVEQLAAKDHVRSQTWMDFRDDVEEITVQVVQYIVHELVQETVFETLVELCTCL